MFRFSRCTGDSSRGYYNRSTDAPCSRTKVNPTWTINLPWFYGGLRSGGRNSDALRHLRGIHWGTNGPEATRWFRRRAGVGRLRICNGGCSRMRSRGFDAHSGRSTGTYGPCDWASMYAGGQRCSHGARRSNSFRRRFAGTVNRDTVWTRNDTRMD